MIQTADVLGRDSAALINTVTKSKLGRKDLFHLIALRPRPSLREALAETQSRNQEAGAEAETMAAYCLLD